MKISDILGMSFSNLWRRKTRSVLTILGVIVGTASIVVMMSLGIGLKQAMMDEVSMAGGLTEIMVYSEGDYGMDELLLSDDTVDTFMELDHVESVEPQLAYPMPIQAGKYEGYFDIIGASQEYLSRIELGEGTLPEADSATLNLVFGNQAIGEFWESATGSYPYYEFDELPDINLLTTPLIGGIEIEEDYQDDVGDESTQESSSGYFDDTFSDSGYDFSVDADDFVSDSDDSENSEDGIDAEEENWLTNTIDDDFMDNSIAYSSFTPSMKRVRLKGTGVTKGDVDLYTEYSYACYTDLDSLKTFLKKNYPANSVIPGQPTDKDGKPYRDLKYTQLTVNVDESTNVEEVLETIQDMGYRADANKEWLEQIEQQFIIIEAVLGGIGAVAMFVAAISIANTMTMSIYERTKEIGVMKVLGCSLGNIRSMFLAEAAAIGFFGGIAGIGLSYILSILANKVVAPTVMSEYGTGTDISLIPLWLVLIAIAFSTLIGMIAGFFPAQRATKLSPLAAIRNE